MNIPDYEYFDYEDEEEVSKKDHPEYDGHLTGWNELFLKDELKRSIR